MASLVHPKIVPVNHFESPSSRYLNQWLFSSTTVCHHHPSKRYAIQICPPLRRPKRHNPDLHNHTTDTPKPHVPNPHNHKRINPERPRAPTSTTSDVLCLMDSLRLPIPPDIYASLIKECTVTRDAVRAAELHAHVKRTGFRPDVPFLNRLLLMHVSCGSIANARQLFDEMTRKDFYSWATMIAGYVDNGDYEEALEIFVTMLQYHGNILEFPAWIIVSTLKACVNTTNMGFGEQVHGWILKVGYPLNLFLSSSLINFYGKFSCLEGADLVFDQMSHRDTVIWTTKIVNNCKEKQFNEALTAFKEMGKAGIKKNHFTFSSVLKACGRMQSDGQCGQQVHANAIKLGIETDIFVQCGLVDMYGKCGLLRDARVVFEMIGNKKNAACWNAMLTGYIKHEFSIEAVKFLYQMKAAGIQPQKSIINEVRIVCGSNGLA